MKNQCKKLSKITFLSILLLCSSYQIYAAPTTSIKRIMPFMSKEETVCPYPYKLEDNAELIIEAQSGSITLVGSDRDTLQIRATKKGLEEDLTKTIIRCSLEKTRAHIITQPKEDAGYVAVNYTVSVPSQVTSVTITLHDGSIVVDNVDTALDVRGEQSNVTISGAQKSTKIHVNKGVLDIGYKTFDEQSSIFAQTLRGDVTVHVPKNARAYLNVRTTKGIISTDIPVTLEPRTIILDRAGWRSMQKEVRGILGVSDNVSAPITVDVTHGNVAIMALEKPQQKKSTHRATHKSKHQRGEAKQTEKAQALKK